MKDHQNIQLRIMNIIIIHIILLGANPTLALLVRARQLLQYQYRFSRSLDVIMDNWLEIKRPIYWILRMVFVKFKLFPVRSSHPDTPFYNFDFHAFLLIFPREVDRFTWIIPKIQNILLSESRSVQSMDIFLKLAIVTRPCIVHLCNINISQFN